MGIIREDVVIIRQPEIYGDPEKQSVRWLPKKTKSLTEKRCVPLWLNDSDYLLVSDYKTNDDSYWDVVQPTVGGRGAAEDWGVVQQGRGATEEESFLCF